LEKLQIADFRLKIEKPKNNPTRLLNLPSEIFNLKSSF